MVELPQI